MSNTDHTKSGGKSGQRKGKQQRDQKLERQPRSLRPDQPQAARELSEVAVAAADTSPIGMAQPAETSPVGLQTIATAYRDYTRKSFADAQSFVEKLSGARSIDKAFEVQSEFAKQAYETFMADSWRIRALYGELVRQTLRPPTGRHDR